MFQKSKSLTAAKAILGINSEIKIEAHQHKGWRQTSQNNADALKPYTSLKLFYFFRFFFTVVCPETEEVIYNDEFFRIKNVIVNALDNVEARRYVDR